MRACSRPHACSNASGASWPGRASVKKEQAEGGVCLSLEVDGAGELVQEEVAMAEGSLVSVACVKQVMEEASERDDAALLSELGATSSGGGFARGSCKGSWSRWRGTTEGAGSVGNEGGSEELSVVKQKALSFGFL